MSLGQNLSIHVLRRKLCHCLHFTIYVCLCHIFDPSMYDISPLHLCYVAVSKLCHLLEFFPMAPLGGGWFKIVFYNKHWS